MGGYQFIGMGRNKNFQNFPPGNILAWKNLGVNVFKFIFLSEMAATFEFNLCYEAKILFKNCLKISKKK